MTKKIKREITSVKNVNQFETQSVMNEFLAEQFEEQKNQQQGIIDHCYFNRKEYEITQVEFAAIKNDNIREILLMMQYGKMRMISVIYPMDTNIAQLVRKSAISGDLGRPSEDDYEYDGSPKIMANQVLSKDTNINCQKQYSALKMYCQNNSVLYRSHGQFENRIFVQLQEQEKYTQNSYWCPDVYTTNEENQIVQLLTMDKFSAQNYVLV